jgi:hypothetical protein
LELEPAPNHHHHRQHPQNNNNNRPYFLGYGLLPALAASLLPFFVAAGAVRVQLRAHGASLTATVVPLDAATVRLALDEPAFGVAVGQSAACYDAEDIECLGGGTIVAADRSAAALATPS